MLIPDSQVKKVIQGGSDEMNHLLLGAVWDEDWELTTEFDSA